MKFVILFVLGFAAIQAAFLSQNLSFSSQNDDDSVAEVQQIFNGFWAAINIDEPSGLAQSCFDENAASFMLSTLNETLADLAVNNVVKAFQAVSKFYHGIDPNVNVCMNNNSHVQEMYQTLGVVNMTVAQLNSKFLTYVVSHLEKVHQVVVSANDDFQAGNNFQVGQDGGQFALDVFNTSSVDPYMF